MYTLGVSDVMAVSWLPNSTSSCVLLKRASRKTERRRTVDSCFIVKRVEGTRKKGESRAESFAEEREDREEAGEGEEEDKVEVVPCLLCLFCAEDC